MAFNEMLGVSIVEKYLGVTEKLVAHGIHYMEVRVVKGNDPDLIRNGIGKLFSELKNINYDSYMIAECGVLANFPDTISEFCEKWKRLHA